MWVSRKIRTRLDFLSIPQSGEKMRVCVFFFSSHSFWTSSSLNVPAGVTQEEGHTRLFIHLPSAVRALIFLARRIQLFLSPVDRESNLCTINNDLIVLHSLGIFFFFFFSEKNPVDRNRTHVPTCQKVTRLPLSYRGNRLVKTFIRWDHRLRIQNIFMAFERVPDGNNTGSTVLCGGQAHRYTVHLINNRHAGTPDKDQTQKQCTTSSNTW